MNQQLLDETEYDVKNYADLGECDLHNSQVKNMQKRAYLDQC